MSNIEKNSVQEIITLHNEIANHLKTSLQKAIRIGELLTDQKESLKHGEFTPWMKANLPFTDRTARNYMRFYRERDRLKTETVSDLKTAYRLIAAPKEESDIERLRRELDEVGLIEDRVLRLKEYGRIRDEANEIAQIYASDVLIADRDLGRVLKDIKNNWPEWDSTLKSCEAWIYLFNIRDKQLYKESGHETFEDFYKDAGANMEDFGYACDTEKDIRSFPEIYDEMKALL